MQIKQFMKDKRRLLPLLIVDLDGAVGYWDEGKNYNMHPSVLQYLHALSTNYRIAGVSKMNKKQVQRLCKQLVDQPKGVVFDAAYSMPHDEIPDLTKIIDDFYLESHFEMRELQLQNFVRNHSCILIAD